MNRKRVLAEPGRACIDRWQGVKRNTRPALAWTLGWKGVLAVPLSSAPGVPGVPAHTGIRQHKGV